MSCLRSFNLRMSLQRDQTGTSIKTWTSGTENFWSLNSAGVSTVNIQGYKNINIYGVDVVGNLSTNTTSAINGVIVNDWTVNVFINGVNPIIDAVVTTSPNNYGIINSTTANNIFALGKYNNSLRFASPYQSVQSIQFQDTNAFGIGYQSALGVNVLWNMNFIFFYKFEGEED